MDNNLIKNNQLDIGLRIKMINELMAKDCNRMLEDLDLTFTQHHVLVYLDHQENKITTLKDIEKTFKVAQATMAGIIKRLELKGYVVTSYKSNDKRAKFVTLTDSGLKVCKESFKHVVKTEETIESVFNQQEIEQLCSYLDRLFYQIEKLSKEK